MARKLLMLGIVVALIAIGALIGKQLGGDNRATVVGESSRYSGGSGVRSLTQSVGASGTGQVHEVRDGGSIQAAVSGAKPGDVIRVFPGTYSESVYIDKDDILLSGVVLDGAWPIMEGNKELNDAVLYSGNDITVENLHIQHYKATPSWVRRATTS
jgi:pectin methylesterase-like acyl-CoA thioesterase